MKILYYDCFAGISGDMHLGAMIDAGVDPEHLLSELAKLPVGGFRLDIRRDQKHSIEGTRVDVVLDQAPDPASPHEQHKKAHGHSHDDGHDHQHTHGRDHEHSHIHGHSHSHTHVHNHSYGHSHTHEHPHRNLDDIEQIIGQSGLTEGTKSRARKMFHIIAEAEAKIHGVPVSKIHFHEVGALDSIVDIIGTAVCLEYLNPDRILCSTVELGSGTVRCAHGTMPVPAPATAEILKNAPVKMGGTGHEATTPTGAAILAANVDEFTDRPEFRPERTAYGIGQRDADLPNVLRVFIGHMDDAAFRAGTAAETEISNKAEAAAPGTVAIEATLPTGARRDEKTMIACQIDDMNPEQYPHIMERLLTLGASDVSLTPVIMKKGRPGLVLDVLCDPGLTGTLSEVILRETTTLGVRYHPVSRIMLQRDEEIFQSSLGPVRIKKAWLDGKLLKWKAEYEDCKSLAGKHDMPLRDVVRLVDEEFARNVIKKMS
jgi:pyridinium-3,5-bisthiocarboxylic acid mononucleotide nickel chelatase